MTPDQEPRPDCTCGAYWDGDLSVPHSAGCAMGVRERAERNVLEQKAILDLLAETDGPDQEPRTGGVAVVEHHTLSIDGRPRYFTAAGGETPTHIAYTLAEAEALIRELNELRDEHWEGMYDEAVGERDEARARAEALIDPSDPAVRKTIHTAIYDCRAENVYRNSAEITDAVLTALRGAK